MSEQRWKWGTLTDLEVKDEEPEFDEGYFMWFPDGPWIERPPKFDADETGRFRKVIDCFTLNLLTDCFIRRCDRVMACGNTEICRKLFGLSEKIIDILKEEDRPLGTAIWCPYELDVVDDRGRVVRRQPDCSKCTYRSGCIYRDGGLDEEG